MCSELCARAEERGRKRRRRELLEEVTYLPLQVGG